MGFSILIINTFFVVKILQGCWVFIFFAEEGVVTKFEFFSTHVFPILKKIELKKIYFLKFLVGGQKKREIFFPFDKIK